MSKKFKGKLCAYCVREKATTIDHVFAREFFTLADRQNQNLPKAPACQKCNGEKSKFEHYLMTTLPFAGRHVQAVENLQSNVPGRLTKNQKLRRQLLDSTKPGWIREDGGIYQRTSMMDFEGDKLEGWLKFIGRGLAWHHWQLYLRPQDDVSVMLMPDQAGARWSGLTSSWRNASRVVGNLGNGTVRYVGVQAPEPPELTMWTVEMYGGLVLSDDRRKQDGEMSSCSMWWIFTGPPEVHEGFEQLKHRDRAK